MDIPVGIEIYDNVVDNCPEIIQWMEDQRWNKSMALGASNDYRTSDSLVIPIISFHNIDIVHQMNKKVWSIIDEYARRWDVGFSDLENVSVQRYEIGQYYNKHSDAGVGIPRVISAVFYLNDVEKGGETEFSYFDFRVSPKEGRLVVFPSNYVYTHAALPPISNKKYAAAYWARS